MQPSSARRRPSMLRSRLRSGRSRRSALLTLLRRALQRRSVLQTRPTLRPKLHRQTPRRRGASLQMLTTFGSSSRPSSRVPRRVLRRSRPSCARSGPSYSRDRRTALSTSGRRSAARRSTRRRSASGATSLSSSRATTSAPRTLLCVARRAQSGGGHLQGAALL